MPDHTMLRTYRDAVAVVTGGASGIGRALAEELSRRGAEVVVADLQADLAEEVAAGIRARGGQATAEFLDVTDFAAVQRLVGATADARGRIDYLFNNAGIAVLGELVHYQIEDWYRVLDVNLRGVVHGVQAVYPILWRQGFGHIVNTASIAGLLPVAGLLSYSASKHAVVGLSTSLRIEAAAAGVRVSVLCPGAIETPIVSGGKFGKILQPAPEEVRRRLWEKNRPISPERCAREALDGVARNRAVLVVPSRWRIAWWLYRLSPSLALALSQRRFQRFRRKVEDAGRAAGPRPAPDPPPGQP
jgi:NAD(P)-dependent dehydrogenase (short-subunit alcohol dehydrogenase family)